MTNGTHYDLGMKVEILASTHAGVAIGAKGVIDSAYLDGFGVKIEGSFYSPGGSKRETRVIWFPKKALKPLNEVEEIVSNAA